MYMETAQDLHRGTVFGFIEFHEYQFTASRHTTWRWKGITVDHSEGRPMPQAWYPFPFDPWTKWEIRLDIGRLNIKGSWRNGKGY